MDDQRRRAVQRGDILFYSRSAASQELCDLAKAMVEEAFGDLDPEHAQKAVPVTRFVDIVGALKTRFATKKPSR